MQRNTELLKLLMGYQTSVAKTKSILIQGKDNDEVMVYLKHLIDTHTNNKIKELFLSSNEYATLLAGKTTTSYMTAKLSPNEAFEIFEKLLLRGAFDVAEILWNADATREHLLKKPHHNNPSNGHPQKKLVTVWREILDYVKKAWNAGITNQQNILSFLTTYIFKINDLVALANMEAFIISPDIDETTFCFLLQTISHQKERVEMLNTFQTKPYLAQIKHCFDNPNLYRSYDLYTAIFYYFRDSEHNVFPVGSIPGAFVLGQKILFANKTLASITADELYMITRMLLKYDPTEENILTDLPPTNIHIPNVLKYLLSDADLFLQKIKPALEDENNMLTLYQAIIINTLHCDQNALVRQETLKHYLSYLPFTLLQTIRVWLCNVPTPVLGANVLQLHGTRHKKIEAWITLIMQEIALRKSSMENTSQATQNLQKDALEKPETSLDDDISQLDDNATLNLINNFYKDYVPASMQNNPSTLLASPKPKKRAPGRMEDENPGKIPRTSPPSSPSLR